MSSFSTTTVTSGTKEFLESNSLVARFSFILLVLFAFVILLKVCMNVMIYFLKPNESPHLFDGMIDATQQKIYYQDPSSNDTTTTIYRSVNENDGIEFTWSVWVNVTNLGYLSDKYRTVFYKGNSNVSANGLNSPNNAPGLYLAPNTNALVVMMNTFNEINEEVTIPNIPVNTWFNVMIRCENTTLDVYINGTIARSVQLHGVPKQNYGDVYVASNGGFQGNISNLWYFNKALGTAEIQRIANNGPNTNFVDGTNSVTTNTWDYLSLRWYFNGVDDGFN
tara:strand:- start:2193 stop:3029 length:837 start_codon:yes stop_codon:yes gene_type:complete